LAKRNVTTTHKQAEVKTNNAGMRSSERYSRKRSGIFRVVCLGDSFVFGTAGKEEDRFCDQLEEYYRKNKITVDGKTIETLALGLGSWTTVQETTYLSSRISAYDPDVIIVLTTGNDISDNRGVTGAGAATRLFSPEHRDWGSAVFSNSAGREFGVNGYTALTTDLSSEARHRWEKAMRSLKNLVELQHRREKMILLSVLNSEGCETEYFHELYKYYVQQSEIEAPFLVTSYFRSIETCLPHDGHPNRYGHEILRDHYVHALHSLGWVTFPDSMLPELDRRLFLEFSPEPDFQKLDEFRKAHIDQHLRSSYSGRFTPESLFVVLGGLFPERRGKEALNTPPWLSIRSAFLLKVPDSVTQQVEVEINAPPLVELFPLTIDLYVDALLVGTYHFPTPVGDNHYHLVAKLPPKSIEDGVVEVLLKTEQYFTTISDPRMKSFRLIAAHLK
jgi:lysophospholipase L1-like esterase